MKKFFYLLSAFILSFTFNIQTQTQNTDNPFFKEWNTPFQTPPFSEIKHGHFLTAYEEGIRKNNLEIEAITNSKEDPTFKNTITAIEKSGDLLIKVNKVFSSLNSTDTDDEMQKIAEQSTSMLSKHIDDFYLNEKLFQR
ncbi:MAG: peptidase M3, partial [Ignavibacteriaceae bacterium]